MGFSPTTAGCLVVDVNGMAGYQSGADYVFQLQASLHNTSLDASDFV